MKKKRLFVPLLAALVLGLSLGLVSTAAATPSRTSLCSNCHDVSSAVTVTATLVSASAATSVYSIAVNNPYGSNAWAVFQGSTKQSGTSGSGTNVTLPNGVTSTVFGVSGNGNGTVGYAVKSVTPAAPVSDATAPTTTSDAQATYLNSATIHLSATDNTGGSGVAHTYYRLDGGAQVEGTTVSTSVVGAHTLEFWSIDSAGNVESPHKTANFAVAVPAPDVTAPITTSDALADYVHSATIHLTAADNVGGSGVASTYYILDGGTQTAGAAINTSVVGAHTLEFWSVDAAGNVENPHGVANFTVTAAATVTKTHTYTYKFKLKKKTYKKLKAVLTSKANGKKYTVTVSRKGVATFKKIPAGSYKLSTTGNKRFKFKAKTVRVGPKAHHHHDDDD